MVVLVLLAVGCERRERQPGVTTTSAAPVTNAAASGGGERPAAAPSDTPPLQKPLASFLPADGLRNPAAAIHDEKDDVYLVSNVDGAPVAADGKGFISKLDPEGKRILPRWIESGRNNVVLNAPKGMAIRNDELFVADIDTVRIFDRVTGAPRGEVKVTGTKFLHSVALAPDGGILVSDAGLKANTQGTALEESGTDSVYVIYSDPKTVRTMLIAKPSAMGPTGLLPTNNKLWTIGGRNGELFSLDNQGKVEDVEKLPDVALEGLVAVGGDLLVSSRAASAIYRGKPGGPWRIAVGDVKSAGDIAYDHKRGRLLVPLSTEDEVRIYEIR
jgi:hypothetical protein